MWQCDCHTEYDCRTKLRRTIDDSKFMSSTESCVCMLFTSQLHSAKWHYHCVNGRAMGNHARAKIKVLPIFVDPIAAPATSANTLIFLCICDSMIHSIATVNERRSNLAMSLINTASNDLYSLWKSNLSDYREHWMASPDPHNVSDSRKKFLNLELDKCMDAAVMPTIPLKHPSGIQMAAFPLRQHNR